MQLEKGRKTNVIKIRLTFAEMSYKLRTSEDLESSVFMKARNLGTVWGAPDNSRLTKKQISIRLPVLVAAQIEAILEMYPRRKRTDVIGDLLSAALSEFEEGLESEAGEFLEPNPVNGKYVFEEIGPKGRFRDLTNEHLKRLESELGNENPELLQPAVVERESGEGA